METFANEKTAEHLMHLIVTRNGETPNFSLLLGSGASYTSGVKTAYEMIEEWRRLLFQQSKTNEKQSKSDEEYGNWLSSQSWFEHEDEYAILFETICDEPAQRRIYIEECVKKAHPGWGYVYLSHLLKDRFFDGVFTTNFDDLINEACYLYSEGLRPIVAAHDSAIQGIRITAERPKIIKLHGDFLYDNIKNTLAELETLESNTKNKLRQFAQEYGLIVLGYSGRDRSVMDTLELLLRDEEKYKQGVYWCIQRGASKSARLQALLRRDRVYLVEIDGFDQFMAELHQKAGLNLPRPVARPFDMAVDRARLFVETAETLRPHPIIETHLKELLMGIVAHEPGIPMAVQAATLSSKGEYLEAIPLWEQSYKDYPDNVFIAYQYANALTSANREEELVNFLQNSPLLIHNKTYFLLRIGRNEDVIKLATAILNQPASSTSLQEDRAIIRINRAIAFKRLQKMDEMKDDLDFLEQNGDTQRAHLRAGVAALEGDKERMFDALEESLHKTIAPESLKVFPVFEDYQDDPDFIVFCKQAIDDS